MLHFQYYPVLPADIHLGEYQIEAGQALLLRLASANRDEAHFPIPRRSRVADSLIGTWRIHFCLGAHLASLEAAIAMWVMLERLKDMK